MRIVSITRNGQGIDAKGRRHSLPALFVAAKSWNINPPERRKIGNFKLDKVSSVLNHGTWTEDQMRPEGFEMALFFGVNVGLVESSDAFKRPGNSAATQPPRLLRWLFRKRQARFG